MTVGQRYETVFELQHLFNRAGSSLVFEITGIRVDLILPLFLFLLGQSLSKAENTVVGCHFKRI